MLPEIKKISMRDDVKLNVKVIENGSPSWIIVSHGIGEHSGRHRYIFDLFSQYFNICIYDLRGHGESEGRRGYIDNFKTFVHDLDSVKSFLTEAYSMKDYILYGHSMGALVVSSYIQNICSKDSYPSKVFLSNPPVAANGTFGKFFDLLPSSLMSGIKNLPFSAPIGGLVDLSLLSHDQRVANGYKNDKLNILKIHTKLFFELLNESKQVYARPLRVSCELYCAIASADAIVNPQNSQRYFKNVEKNAKVKVIEDGYHELHNEVERFRSQYFDFLKSSLSS